MSKTVKEKPIINEVGQQNLLLNGRVIQTETRLITEHNYQLMLKAEEELTAALVDLIRTLSSTKQDYSKEVVASSVRAMNVIQKHREDDEVQTEQDETV